MFDGRNYGGVRAIRKIYYHSRAVHVGAALSTMLLDAYCVARNRGRRLVSKNWVRNLRDPALYFYDPDETISHTDYRSFFVWQADIAEHWTHVRAHVCFTINSELGQFAKFIIEVTDGVDTNLSTATVVELAPDAAGQILEGTLPPFQGRGSYEALVEVSLEDIDLPGPVDIRLAAYAYYPDTAEPPVNQAAAMRIDALDLWVESRG